MIDKIVHFATASNKVLVPGIEGSYSYSTGLPRVKAGTTELQSILSIVFGTIAAIAVLIIVIAGFKFATSSGKPENAARARETIIYAVVGLVISLSAEAIVAFVLTK